MSKLFYVTTAIDYVNGEPHLGHAYEKIVADVIARARRSFEQETFLLTGLDEHGQKVQQAALAEGKSPRDYCDRLAVVWQNFVQKLGLTNNDFIRTTEPRHQQIVQAILSKLHAEGQFYEELYEGYYSNKEETFLTEKDRLPDGSFPAAYGEVIRLKERNFYFKLRDQQQWLIDYIEQNPSFVQPDHRRNEVLGFLKHEELEDLCITRPVTRLKWGIPFPVDPAYVTYVWFDALVNYVSVAAAHNDPVVLKTLGLEATPGVEPLLLWPADIHVIGKDIVKFHAVYWPIMLKAMGLPLPKQVLAHGWWQKDGEKMSKTLGNVVEPISVIDEWGLDAFRFYVLRELDIGADGNWTDDGFKKRYNSELADGLGNLVNRSLSMLRRYRNGLVPPPSNLLAAETKQLVQQARQSLEENHLQAALLSIWALVTRANQYVEQTAPFKLAKDPSKAAQLDEALYNLVEVCRILAVLLWPFLPETAEKIYVQLGLKQIPNKFSESAWGGLAAGHAIGTPVALFPKKTE